MIEEYKVVTKEGDVLKEKYELSSLDAKQGKRFIIPWGNESWGWWRVVAVDRATMTVKVKFDQDYSQRYQKPIDSMSNVELYDELLHAAVQLGAGLRNKK